MSGDELARAILLGVLFGLGGLLLMGLRDIIKHWRVIRRYRRARAALEKIIK